MRSVVFGLMLMALPSLAHAQGNQVLGGLYPPYSGTTKTADAIGHRFADGSLFALGAPTLQFPLPFTISYNIKLTVVGISQFIDTRNGLTNKGFWSGFCNTLVFCEPGFPVTNQTASTSTTCSNAGQNCMRPLTDKLWHNVCWRVTSTASYYYLDGILVDTNAKTPVTYTPQTGYWAVQMPTSIIGNMLDIRAYNADIGASGCQQLGSLFKQGLVPTSGSLQSNLAGHWYMDNCDTVGCADSSGNGNNLIYETAPPTCTITSPTAGFNAVGSVNLQATCTDAIAVNSVDWFVDGAWQGRSTTGPNYTVAWDATKFIDGAHTVSLVALNAGQVPSVTPTVSGTSTNSVAAKTFFYDPVAGNDANTCLSSGSPCQTLTGIQAKVNANPLHGGDSILQKAGTNLNITNLTTQALNLAGPLCDVTNCNGQTQNVYPGHTITYGQYGGTGNCFVLAGITNDCASITLTADGDKTRNFGIINFINVANVTISGMRLSVSQPGTLSCAGEHTGGCSWALGFSNANGYYNGNISGASTTITNNELIDGQTTLYVSIYSDPGDQSSGIGFCGINVTDNYIHGVAFPIAASAMSSEGPACHYGSGATAPTSLTYTSNYVTNSGGNGLVVTNGFVQIVDNFNVAGPTGINGGTACGATYGNWWFQGKQFVAKGNETFNQFPTTSTSAGCDIGAFDFDLGTSFGTFEFNYAHETWGPSLGFFGRPAGLFQAGANTAAYSIFENGSMQGKVEGDGTVGSAMTVPSSDLAGPVTFINNTIWNGYNGGIDITNGHLTYVGTESYGLVCSIKPNWINLVANIINVSSANGTSAYMINGGSQPACLTITHASNDYFALSGVAVFSNVLTSTTFFGVTAWNAASGDTGIAVDPGFVSGGSGGTCYVSGVPVAPGSLPCPTAYQLPGGSSLISHGLDLTQAPYSLTLPTTDFYGNAVPNGVGATGYNYGADGDHH